MDNFRQVMGPAGGFLAALCLAAVFILPLAGGAFAVGAKPATAEESGSPTQTVERLHETLIGMMRDGPALGFEGRRARLAPVVADSFDLVLMTRLIVGQRWNEFSDDERKAVVKAFGDWTIANYAGQFTSFDNERFVTVGEAAAPRDTVLVKTRLDYGADSSVAFDYRMSNRQGKWQIIDIYLDGTVSELATRRSEFGAALKTGGAAALVARLDEKIVEMAAGDKAAPL